MARINPKTPPRAVPQKKIATIIAMKCSPVRCPMIFGFSGTSLRLLHHQDRREHPQAGEPAAVRLEEGDGQL